MRYQYSPLKVKTLRDSLWKVVSLGEVMGQVLQDESSALTVSRGNAWKEATYKLKRGSLGLHPVTRTYKSSMLIWAHVSATIRKKILV